MKWNPDRKTYTVSAKDIKLLHQFGKDGILPWLFDLPQQGHLPPLWSAASYLMLFTDDERSTAYFWKQYRQLQQMVRHPHWYYRRKWIPKRSGGKRQLLVPEEPLAAHQRFILRQILRQIPVAPCAYAYCPGRGIRELAQPHVGHRRLVHLDIRDFFPSVTEQMVFDALHRATGYPKGLVNMLTRLCCCDGHLPQGAATSPALSNICFRECDEQIMAYCAGKGLTYTRYSDDLFISGNSMDVRRTLETVCKILRKQGFRLHTDKTKVLGRHQKQKITAVVVNQKLQVSREYRRGVRQEVYYLQKFGRNCKGAQEADSYESYLRKLLGKIAFILYVDPNNQEFRQAHEAVCKRLWEYEPWWAQR